MKNNQKINKDYQDKGFTADACGGKVLKDSLHCRVCGELDELSSFLGLAKSVISRGQVCELIERVQCDLLLIGSEVAAGNDLSRLRRRLDKRNLNFLKEQFKLLQQKYDLSPNGFILPGENIKSASLDVARAVARRVERNLVSLNNKNKLTNNCFIAYLNKLSDLLFLLGRLFENNQVKRT